MPTNALIWKEHNHMAPITKLKALIHFIWCWFWIWYAGDDCISIVNATSNIKMKRILCGPGHGVRYSLLWLYVIKEPYDGPKVTSNWNSNFVFILFVGINFGCQHWKSREGQFQRRSHKSGLGYSIPQGDYQWPPHQDLAGFQSTITMIFFSYEDIDSDVTWTVFLIFLLLPFFHFGVPFV